MRAPAFAPTWLPSRDASSRHDRKRLQFSSLGIGAPARSPALRLPYPPRRGRTPLDLAIASLVRSLRAAVYVAGRRAAVPRAAFDVEHPAERREAMTAGALSLLARFEALGRALDARDGAPETRDGPPRARAEPAGETAGETAARRLETAGADARTPPDAPRRPDVAEGRAALCAIAHELAAALDRREETALRRGHEALLRFADWTSGELRRPPRSLPRKGSPRNRSTES